MTRWSCPRCTNHITLHITPVTAPTCTRHTPPQPMETYAPPTTTTT